ncbi:hypothetical protein ACK8OR_17815 [Jannaschia sp. KMU-145]|uniref:hypothetical protein n=1 Tax=Jannaschia halovivens TaxID=3388667 RepID=UPI00396AF901
MRVSIKHETVTRGAIFKKTFYEVRVAVLMSHEELQIIRQRNLLATKLLDRRPANAKVDDRDDKFDLFVKDIINGKEDRFLCPTPSDAKRYEDRMLHTLSQLKLWINDNAETSEGIVVEL